MQSGVGSAACGQALLGEYRLSAKEFTFSLKLRPITNQSGSLLSTALTEYTN